MEIYFIFIIPKSIFIYLQLNCCQLKIRIINRGNRNLLACEQESGRFEITEIGSNLPFHNLAHYIVERGLNLKHGFFGHIYKGYTVEQLSNKEIIKTLHVETVISEISARALQSLSSGDCNIDRFPQLIYEEFNKFSIVFSLHLTEEKIIEMLLEYKSLLEQWKELSEGEGIEVHLDLEK